MPYSILVIADCGPDELTALEKARQLAEPFDASLDVIRFIPGTPGDDLGAAIDQAAGKLGSDIDRVFADSKPNCQVVVSEDLSAWITSYCKQHPVDLVIKTGHRSEQSFYTPTDWHLIRNLPCPILIASDRKWRARPVVMATVDLREDSRAQQALNQKVLAAAPVFSRAMDCEIQVVYSLPIPRALLELDIIEQESYARSHQEELEQLMQSTLSEASLQDARYHIQAGVPAKTIPSLANKLKADLVIVGSVGRKGLSGALLGNTAEKLLGKLRTDVLVVKP